MNDSINSASPRYGILAVLLIGAFISFLNNTLLNVALPSIMTDLDVNTSTVQWLSTGYMLINGILMPTTAFLIQKFSVRHLFLTAMGLFSIGTMLAGFAPTFEILLSGRMIQACGSAIMMPLLMNVMLVSFPVSKRGSAMGILGLILMFAPAIGPTLSGWIIEHYTWRSLFHFVAPIAFVIFFLGFFLLKDKKEKVKIHLDAFSVVLSTVGFGGLLYGFSSAGSMGWTDPQVYGTSIIGVTAIVWFIRRQSALEQPMLNFGVYRFPMFALASAITVVVNIAMFSGFMLLPIYVQTILGVSPMMAGLMLLPGALVSAFISPITGRLFDKYGGKALAIIGLSIVTVITYLMSNLTFETGYYYLMTLHVFRMLGMSMVMMPNQTNGLNQLPVRMYPHGTAMNNTLNQVSGAIGTALIITVMTMRERSLATKLLAEAGGSPSGEAQRQIAMEAMLSGINFAFFVSTFIILGALILSFLIKRATPMEEGLSFRRK